MKQKLVLVEWTDSTVHGNVQCEPDDPMLRPISIVSTGFLIRSDDEAIVIARDRMNDGTYRGYETILQRQVDRVKRIPLK